MNSQKSAPQLAEQGQIAEALNFHSFWLPENHFSGGASLPSPLLSLAAVSSCTSTIKLATTSFLLPIRNPISAAEDVAVLDQLSQGRLILGVGRGFQNAMFSVYGVDSRHKRKIFAATLKQMLSAWAGEPVGEEQLDHDNTRSLYLSPRPVQTPHPPIWLAAFGPLALKQASSLGFPYLASPMETIEVLAENYRQYHAMIDDHNNDKVTTIPIMRTIFVSEDNKVIARVREGLEKSSLAHGRRAVTAKLDDWAIIGNPDNVLQSIKKYRTELGMTHLVASFRLPSVTEAETISSLRLLSKMSAQL